ncbi:MAG: DUF411 domain-containing protein, partial [Rhodothermales bacterium]|nr:DUF411 domain-containing protein [Rhodothermales bacterium]
VGALIMAFGLFAFTKFGKTESDVSPAQSAFEATVAAAVASGEDKPVSVVTGERKITVYKSATCGCCKSWIAYLEKAGYEVESVDETDMSMVKAKLGVSRGVASCHTGVINGYVVEGHVPVEDIERMLATKPGIVGISAPGMPVGSPGMEQGDRKDPYDVVAFGSSGETAVFASYNK